MHPKLKIFLDQNSFLLIKMGLLQNSRISCGAKAPFYAQN